MREITVLSGKGGAGKTIVTAAFASIAEKSVFCDNDVDAPDLHLILQPEIKEKYDFEGSYIAEIHEDKCTNCGICAENCRFDAIHLNTGNNFEINPLQCEGCRLCERLCPVEAITSEINANNSWYISDTRFGTLVHAQMAPGEENSGKLVAKIREKAKEIAKNLQADFIINDGPPGIGCPVIASVTGTDAVVVVIEPTLSGLHDAQRLMNLVKGWEIPMYAIINKYDINLQSSKKVEEFLLKEKIGIIARLPFDKDVVASISTAKSIIEYMPGREISKQLALAWDAIQKDS